MTSGFINSSVSFSLMILLLVYLQLLSYPISSMGGRPLATKSSKSHNVYAGIKEIEGFFTVTNSSSPSPGQGHKAFARSDETLRGSKFSGPSSGEGHRKFRGGKH